MSTQAIHKKQGGGHTAMRVKRYKVTGQLIAELMTTGRVTSGQLPPSAKFHHGHYDRDSMTYEIAVEDESFPDIQEGDRVEALPVVVRKNGSLSITNHGDAQ